MWQFVFGRAAPVWLALLLICFRAVAVDDPPAVARSAEAHRLEKAYSAAKARYDAHPEDAATAWQFGRACFELADDPASDARREGLANEGIAACRALVKRAPDSAPGHYYLGMDLAQLARTKSIGALKIVREMKEEFTVAIKLEAKFDYGGADRNLGILLRDAPGWPISIGDKARALQHMRAAIMLAPVYPENHLNLVESLLQWGDKPGARQELKALAEQWPAARKELTGEQWASAWGDWEQRRKDCETKLSVPR